MSCGRLALGRCVILFPEATTGVQYRVYQDGDFPRLYAIEEVCFKPPLRFGRGVMRRLIESPASATWIGEEEDGTMLGFAIVEWTAEPDNITAYIPTIEVLPEQRRRGLGAELLRRLEGSAVEAGAELIWLHVDAENDAAIRLYCAAGYERKGRHEHYYERYRAAEVYMKVLTGSGKVEFDVPESDSA